MKQLLKRFIPKYLKLQFKLFQRYFDEKKNKYFYTKTYSSENIGLYQTELKQVIRKGEFYGNKLHNLKIVAGKINNLVILPDEVFSFWKLVGKPNEKNQFKKGRNLIRNNISNDFGGGICQFSSILYFLALKSGLKIIERFPHSIDIYKEEERFTPLGADCTVVYGYKDLQIQNLFSFPVQLKCFVSDDEFHLCLISPKKIDENLIDFNYSETEKGVLVRTLCNGKLLYKDFYLRF